MEAIATTFGVDWPHLTAQIISFSIVCALLYRFAYQPVLRMLAQRRAQIAQGIANTEKIDAALAGIADERRQTLAAGHAEAARAIADAHAVAARVKERETQRATATADEIVRRARDAAAEEHTRMLAALRREVGHLVVQTTAAVAGRVLTPDDQRRLADDATAALQ